MFNKNDSSGIVVCVIVATLSLLLKSTFPQILKLWPLALNFPVT